MLIREAKESDVLFLKRLLVQLGYPDQDETGVQQRINHHGKEGYRLLVAEIDQEVVGFIALHWFHLLHLAGNLGRISAFCVDERFRSQGIGMRLLETAEELLKSKGCGKIEVMSNLKRTRTHQFYLKQKYTEESKRFVKYV